MLKHRSSHTPAAKWADRLPRSIASMVANPWFALALVFDGGAVALQFVALRYGGLTVVQPILTAALVISLLLDHAIARTRVSGREMALAGLLVAGLVVFLMSSGAMSPPGEVAIGERVPGLVLAGLGLVLLVASLVVAARAPKVWGARALALTVAAVYATTAALMKSTTRIQELHGFGAVLLSWQLWALVVVAVAGLVLNQRAFSLAPLRVSLPVIASLDPLFSVVVGVAVYDEQLRTTPLAVLGELLGLGLLLGAVALLSLTGVEEGEPIPLLVPGNPAPEQPGIRDAH